MGVDKSLLEAAVKLVKAAHEELDKAMPARLAGIVKTHAALGVAAGWIPIPGADLAACAATIWGMYYRINDELKIPFRENVVKSVASGVAANMLSYVAFAAVVSALKIIPGVGTLAAAAVLSAAAYALTLASGYVYMKALTLLLEQKSADSITEADLESAVNQVMSDRESIRALVQQARTSYKKDDVSAKPRPEEAGKGARASSILERATAWLVVLRGADPQTAYQLHEGRNVIGRADDKPVDVDLEAQELPDRVWSSRQHAAIMCENESFILEDLGSSNGTFVNGKRAQPGQRLLLRANDIIQIGTVQLQLVLEEP